MSAALRVTYMHAYTCTCNCMLVSFLFKLNSLSFITKKRSKSVMTFKTNTCSYTYFGEI